MALHNATVKLLIFFLVFSIIFPVAGYTFTYYSAAPETSTLDPQSLIDAGIILSDAVSHNLTRDNEYVHFDVGDWQFRVWWFTDGRFVWERRNNVFGFELAPITLTPSPMYEADVIIAWDSQYNWTHVTLDEDGGYESECFFTIYPGYDTITASLTAGKVTMTIGRRSRSEAPGLFTFAGWFLGLLTGVNTFGLPEVFCWFLRIFTFIGVLAFVILAKEFIPTLP